MADLSDKHQRVLEFFSVLPQRIVALHGSDNVAEFLLYEICNHDNFCVKKAAFFVDSPDFNTMKGVAGINTDNSFTDNHWDAPGDFSHHMSSCDFNTQVRSHAAPSIHNSPYDPITAAKMAKDLNFKKPLFYSWRMKHDNYGFVIYEQADANDLDQHMFNSLHLLSFCPVF